MDEPIVIPAGLVPRRAKPPELVAVRRGSRALVGNMVSPPPARALVEANCADLPWWGQTERMAA